MSLTPTPAFISSCNGWEERFRDIRVYDWMWDFNDKFDGGELNNLPYDTYNTQDFTFQPASGAVLPPGEASWAAVLEQYKPFAAHQHQPRFFVIWEDPAADNTYQMVGCADVFGDL